MDPRSRLQLIAAGTIGNMLEWYDFAIYGYFAVSIGHTFVPRGDPVAQVLAAFGVFAVGYLMRPLGGVLTGVIGDRYGRRAALSFSVTAMAVPTFLIGILPGYHSLGVMAPTARSCASSRDCRSAANAPHRSSSWSSAHRRPARRDRDSCASATCGMMLGSAMGAVLSLMMSTEALDTWGWRIPFLLGLLVGVVGYFLRRDIVEAPRQWTSRRLPLVEVVRDHTPLLLRLVALSALNSIGFFVVFIYIVTWLQRNGVPPARALGINTISMAGEVLVMFAVAWWSDRIGRKPLGLAAAALAFVGALPLFWLMHHDSSALIFIGQMGFVLAIGMSWGVLPSILVESTPPGVRCTLIALGFNITMGVIGGLTPLVATWLVAHTHDDLSPAYLIMAAAAVSFLSLLSFAESYKTSVATT